MSQAAIQFVSVILLTAYAVERLGKTIRVPGVIMMILAGLIGKPLLATLGIHIEGLDKLVPALGTFGLILIVLEGALDIELDRRRLRTVMAAIAMAGAGFLLCLLVYVGLAMLVFGLGWFQAALLAVPFAVISSAVAIPGSRFLPVPGREFVVYESSISDILGVLVFFALVNSDGTPASIASELVGGGLLSLALALICSFGLVLVLMRIDGHIRFIPILAGLFGLYAVGKALHLSPLILVLLFGLALNKPSLIARVPVLRGWMDDSYADTLESFKVLVRELTFAVRGFFFILLGYWTDLADLAVPEPWFAAALMLTVLYTSRYGLLRLGGHDLAGQLVWIAPRGLITVLLVLAAGEIVVPPGHLNGAMVLVILVSAALVGLAGRRAAPAPAT